MARYCAFRATNFCAPSDRPDELRHMLEYNVHQEFGVDLHLPPGTLQAKTPVLADGRMQPHEWLLGDVLLKTDSVDHGDNHFFPGPCDIAWDLAGAATEWQMPAEAIRHFLERFRQFSGIDVSQQLPLYLLAYAVFRLGFCKMAVSTSTGDDLDRMHRAYLWYRALAQQRLKSETALNLSAA
jgi:hypothetical protein